MLLSILCYVRDADYRFVLSGRFDGCTVEETERFCERYMVKPGRAVTILDEDGREVDL